MLLLLARSPFTHDSQRETSSVRTWTEREADFSDHVPSNAMAEEHDAPRVTPIDPGPDYVGSPAETRNQRQWLTLVGVPVAAITILLLVFGSGGGNGQETPSTSIPDLAVAATTTTTTTTTLPPTPAGLAPDIAGRLAVFTTEPTPRLLIWEPDDESPRTFALREDIITVSFDASGEHLAYITDDSLVVDRMPGAGGTSLGSSPTAAIWHPTEPQTLAYTLAAPGSVTLAVAWISEDGRIESSIIKDLPEGSRLVAWGSWGYATEEPLPRENDPTGRVVVVYDSTRLEPVRAMPGTVVTAEGDLMLIAGVRDPDAAVAAAAGIAAEVRYPMQGNALLDPELSSVTLELLGDPVDIPTVTISADGSRVAVSTELSTGDTSVALFGRQSNVSMVVPVRGAAVPIGFIADGTYLALHDPGTSELILLHARVGSRVRLPSGPGPILAANARAAPRR
jgi:hypothetical protein